MNDQITETYRNEIRTYFKGLKRGATGPEKDAFATAAGVGYSTFNRFIANAEGSQVKARSTERIIAYWGLVRQQKLGLPETETEVVETSKQVKVGWTFDPPIRMETVKHIEPRTDTCVGVIEKGPTQEPEVIETPEQFKEKFQSPALPPDDYPVPTLAANHINQHGGFVAQTDYSGAEIRTHAKLQQEAQERPNEIDNWFHREPESVTAITAFQLPEGDRLEQTLAPTDANGTPLLNADQANRFVELALDDKMFIPKPPPLPAIMEKTRWFGFNQVRLHTEKEEVWFRAKDVTDLLEIKNHNDALGRLEDFERRLLWDSTAQGDRQVLFVNTSGLMALVFSSRKPEAKRMRVWVTNEVLPSIFKYGRYQLPGKSPVELDGDVMIRSLVKTLEGGQQKMAIKQESILRQQQELEARIDDVREMVEEDRKQRALAARNIASLDKPSLAPLNPRQLIIQRMRRFLVAAFGANPTPSQAKWTWHMLDDEVYLRLKIDLKKRAKNAKISRLDLCDHLEITDKVLEIAKHIWSEERAAQLSASE